MSRNSQKAARIRSVIRQADAKVQPWNFYCYTETVYNIQFLALYVVFSSPEPPLKCFAGFWDLF